MTSDQHRSGTDRVNEVAQKMEADVYINVQGDEPLARPEHLTALIELMQDKTIQVGTLKTACGAEDVGNPNAVKVVTDKRGRALYFSRSTIPFDRDSRGDIAYFKHLGFYAYRKRRWSNSAAWPESSLERSERLEQLRFLENGTDIYVAETPYDTIGVDTEADLSGVEEILRKPPLELRVAASPAMPPQRRCACRSMDASGTAPRSSAQGFSSARFWLASLCMEEMNGSTEGSISTRTGPPGARCIASRH